ncbi:hypothetical protein [Schumannella soli]|nr:hypothetical protein [Schumannella soli]
MSEREATPLPSAETTVEFEGTEEWLDVYETEALTPTRDPRLERDQR